MLHINILYIDDDMPDLDTMKIYKRDFRSLDTEKQSNLLKEMDYSNQTLILNPKQGESFARSLFIDPNLDGDFMLMKDRIGVELTATLPDGYVISYRINKPDYGFSSVERLFKGLVAQDI